MFMLDNYCNLGYIYKQNFTWRCSIQYKAICFKLSYQEFTPILENLSRHEGFIIILK
jgi:hypothetical protein